MLFLKLQLFLSSTLGIISYSNFKLSLYTTSFIFRFIKSISVFSISFFASFIVPEFI